MKSNLMKWIAPLCVLTLLSCSEKPGHDVAEVKADTLSKGTAPVLQGDLPAVKNPEGLFIARQKGLYGFIDKTGRFVIPPRYSQAMQFSEDLAAVSDTTGHWGYIDKTGKALIKLQYNLALPFSGGLASVRAGDKFGVINKSGDLIVIPKFGGISEFSEGLAATLFHQPVQGMMMNSWGFINRTGAFVIKPVFEAATSFGDGMAAVRETGRMWGYIDKDGKYVVKPQFETANQFAEGLASVESSLAQKYRWGFINKEGSFSITPRFTLARTFSEGYGGFQIDDTKWGFVNKTGKVVIPAKYDDIGQFHEGWALVKTGSKEAYIDTAGKVVWSE